MYTCRSQDYCNNNLAADTHAPVLQLFPSWNKAGWPPGCLWTTSAPHSISCKWRIVAWIFFSSLNTSHSVLVFCVGWVRAIRQPCLPLAHVPVQTLGQAFEPVVHQVVAADGGHWVTGCGDLDTVERKSRERITAQSMGEESVMRGQQLTDNYQSPYWISCRFLPSNDTQAVFLASGERVICLRLESTVSFKRDSKTGATY